MGTLPPLGTRLRLAAEWVRPGVPVTDVGTDHAYLPVWLSASGKTPRAVASDVRAGPLRRAHETVARFGQQRRVTLTLADGIPEPDEAETAAARDIVIAGMGGELIARILQKSRTARAPGTHLILQPMTAQAALRAWLCENGFAILREDAAAEAGKHYLLLLAQYGAPPFTPDDWFRAAGRLPETGGREAAAYLRWQAAHMRRQADGLSHSHTRADEAARFAALAEKLEAAAQRCAARGTDEN